MKGIPAFAEELQIARDLFVLEYTGGKLHLPTISTKGAVKLIAEAKKKGLDVSCSVAVHNLWFTDSLLEEYDSKYKVDATAYEPMNIPKSLDKRAQRWYDRFVTSDHCPMNIERKRVEFDNAAYGTIGLESAFGVAEPTFRSRNDHCPDDQRKGSFGLDPRKIKEGEMACLTLFNPQTEHVFEEKHI